MEIKKIIFYLRDQVIRSRKEHFPVCLYIRIECGESCLVSEDWCEGYSYRLLDSVEVCVLYSSILDTGIGSDNGFIWARDTPLSLLSKGEERYSIPMYKLNVLNTIQILMN